MSDNAIAKQETGLVKSKLASALQRMERSEGAVLVADTSGSMNDHTEIPGERRIDALRGVTNALRVQGIGFKTLVFNTTHYWSDEIPEPTGGTNLVGALEFLKTQKPKHVIIVCDGDPDGGDLGRAACIKLAQELGCKVDAYFVGDKRSPYSGPAIEFMNKLASITGGASGAVSFKELQVKIAGALAADNSATQADKPIAL